MTGAPLVATLEWGEVGGYVASAWGISVVVLGGYVASVLRRGRRLSRQVPPESRRWM